MTLLPRHRAGEAGGWASAGSLTPEPAALTEPLLPGSHAMVTALVAFAEFIRNPELSP